MKITRLRTYPRAVKFSKLNRGDTFYLDGDCAEDTNPMLYMKLSDTDDCDEDVKYKYVDVAFGYLSDDIDDDAMVVPVKSTLTVEA